MNLDIEFTIGFADPWKDYPWIIQRKLQGIKNKLNIDNRMVISSV